jgi:hypothetical protein
MNIGTLEHWNIINSNIIKSINNISNISNISNIKIIKIHFLFICYK